VVARRVVAGRVITSGVVPAGRRLVARRSIGRAVVGAPPTAGARTARTRTGVALEPERARELVERGAVGQRIVSRIAHAVVSSNDIGSASSNPTRRTSLRRR